LFAHPAQQVKIYANKSQSVSLRGFVANKFQAIRMSKKFHSFPAPPNTRGAGGLDFSVISGKKQRHGSALFGAGVTGCLAPGLKTPNPLQTARIP
jgi:hypothetical protein